MLVNYQNVQMYDFKTTKAMIMKLMSTILPIQSHLKPSSNQPPLVLDGEFYLGLGNRPLNMYTPEN